MDLMEVPPLHRPNKNQILNQILSYYTTQCYGNGLRWKWTPLKKEFCDNDIIIVKSLFHSTASEETGML